jgi:hypothetical protein
LAGPSVSHPPECVIPDDVLIQSGPPDDEHSLLETCRLSDGPVKIFLLTGSSDSHPQECVTPDDVLIQFGPPDDEHLLLETCRGMK